VSYDFRSPDRLSREGLRALHSVGEAFARSVSAVLADTLRVVPHAGVVSVRQVTCEEYLRTVAQPSLFSVLALDPLAGSGVLQLPTGFVMGVIDRLLGGQGGPQQPLRALTDIETGLVATFVRQIAVAMTPAFAPITPLHAELVALESDTEFLQLVPPCDPVVVSDFELRVGEQVATATLCLPLATLQPALAALAPAPAAASKARSAASEALERRLQQVEIDVTVAFHEVSLTSAEVFSLAVGDVLPLRHPVSEPLVVTADGVAVAAATPGTHGKQLACQIVST
jgi:flagellar motor switch protein FliM